jgi:hypothetical protein
VNKEEGDRCQEKQGPLGETAAGTGNLAAIADRAFEVALGDDVNSTLRIIRTDRNSGKQCISIRTVACR